MELRHVIHVIHEPKRTGDFYSPVPLVSCIPFGIIELQEVFFNKNCQIPVKIFLAQD